MDTAGVNVVGFVRGDFGLGQGVRLTIRALEAAGLEVCPIPFEPRTPHSTTDLSIRNLEASPRFGTNIIRINPDMLPLFIEGGGREMMTGRFNIAYWAWELLEYPDAYLPFMDLFHEIWTPSTFCSQAISRKAPIPVLTFHHPVIESQALGDRASLELPEDRFLVLSILDFCSSLERKNVHATITAFQKAFGEDPSTLLVIKTSKGEFFPAQLRELESRVAALGNVRLLNRVLDRPTLESLIQASDVLVSLHRSEGFGLTLAEAMGAGKPVIATDFSGNRDFMNAANSFPVPCRLTEVIDANSLYGRKELWGEGVRNCWAEPDTDAAAECLKAVRAHPEKASQIAQRGREQVLDELSPSRIGQGMRERLARVSHPVDGKDSLRALTQKVQFMELERVRMNKQIARLERTLSNRIRRLIRKWFHPERGN